MRADVVILGGGIIGCLSAWRLRARGLEVIVVERDRPGAEASGAAAGILGAQAEADRPGPLVTLALRSRALHPALAAELRDETGIDVGFEPSGTLALAHDSEEQSRLVERAAWQRAAGLRVELVSGEEVRAREPELAPCLGGLALPDDHRVDPARLMRALAIAIERAGVRVVHAEARRVRHDGARALGADTDQGSIDAAHVVVAGGSWSALVDGCGILPRAVFPVRGQLVEIDAQRPPFAPVVYGHGGYLVPRRDGRVVVGSTEERAGYRKEVTPEGLERLCARARALCPSLGDRPIARSWSGLRPASADGLPLLGSTEIRGLHLATGHYRNGILLAPITAEIVVALVTDATPPVELAPFSALRMHR